MEAPRSKCIILWAFSISDVCVCIGCYTEADHQSLFNDCIHFLIQFSDPELEKTKILKLICGLFLIPHGLFAHEEIHLKGPEVIQWR